MQRVEENAQASAPAAARKRFVVRFSQDYSCIVEAASRQEAVRDAPAEDSNLWERETSALEAEEEE